MERPTGSSAESQVGSERSLPALILYCDLQLTDDKRRQTVVETLVWQLDRRRAAAFDEIVRNVQLPYAVQRRRTVQTNSVVRRNRQRIVGVKSYLCIAFADAAAALAEYIN